LGTVNSLLKECAEERLIGAAGQARRLTEKGRAYLAPYRVTAAVILAAGFGSRFVPLSYETPKGLLKVFGEPMIERQIRQLHEAGISNIAVVIGYMKEKFEYLTEKYGVQLLFNPEYASKNNLSSLAVADSFMQEAGAPAGRYQNCYILSSDNWLKENIYHSHEAAAWYAAQYAEGPTSEWCLVTDKKGRITDTYPGGRDCLYMYGPAYFSSAFAAVLMPVLKRYYNMPGTENDYWEHVLMELLNGRASRRLRAYYGVTAEEGLIAHCPPIYANAFPDGTIYEFENLEELRAFDPRYREDSGSKAMQLVSRIFGVPESEIGGIRCLKAGMTNNSWLFRVGGGSYICRIPGQGTEKLIDRRQEKAAFDAVKDLGLSEEIIYFNEETGYKISRFYEGSRNADASSPEDMARCMEKLRLLHGSGVRVGHAFDIFERLEYYEQLCLEETPGAKDIFEAVPFADYEALRPQLSRLRKWLERRKGLEVLAHIDPVPDNFIFTSRKEEGTDRGELKLIDWEYAGMCDPLMDIAMCGIYAYMDEERLRALLETYLERPASDEEWQTVCAYVALGGLLWALWAVYKEKLGVSFSDYTIRMYRYFRKYSRMVGPDM